MFQRGRAALVSEEVHHEHERKDEDFQQSLACFWLRDADVWVLWDRKVLSSAGAANDADAGSSFTGEDHGWRGDHFRRRQLG